MLVLGNLGLRGEAGAGLLPMAPALLPAFDGQAAGLWPGQQDCFCSDIWTCPCSPEGHSLRNVLDSSGTWQLGDMAE